MPKRLWVVGVWSILTGACSKDGRDVGLGPLLPPCTASGDTVSLSVGIYAAVNPGTDSGCTVFPANSSGSQIDYLLVPQAANGVPDDASSFLLRGAGLLAAPPALAAVAPEAPLPVQQQFDLTLRRAERELAFQMGPAPLPQAARPVAAAPPVPGTTRTFKVCGDLACSTHPSVTAKAKKVGLHIAVYVDNAATAAGDTLGTADLDTLATVFDTQLYPTDTAAFGHESDIDSNTVVIVLMTGKVNSLVTKSQCLSTGYVAGYFYGGDLLIGYPNGNNGEIFYSLVPDSTGTSTNSCPHPASDVKHAVPGTFIHEFQHMISWGHHVLPPPWGGGSGNPADAEELWLNEGLSHYAEELGGRKFLPDTTTYCYFLRGDLYDAGQYFANPQNYFLVDTAGIGGLANRGAYWLFVRFLVDRLAATLGADDSATRRLDITTLQGAANVSHAAGGMPFDSIVEHWALANYVSDLSLSGFSAPSELQYVKWHFRSDFPTLSAACSAKRVPNGIPSVFPLVPTFGSGSATNLSGTMRGGSGTYYVAQHAAGAPGFTLLFSDGSGRALRASLVPRLNVIRLQ